jgi:hypothetical protein
MYYSPGSLINTPDGDKIIMYSLGNFISGQLAIVDPVEHDLNFAATGISAIFEIVAKKDNNKIRMEPKIKMMANVRNPKRFFVAVKQEDFLKYGMSKEWEDFYIKNVQNWGTQD